MSEEGFCLMLDMITHDLSGDIEKLVIYPISDIHVGTRNFEKEMFKKFVANIAKDKNAYVILCGDLINNNVVGSVGNIFEDEMPPGEQKKWLREELKPIKNKILAVVSGNHDSRSKRLTDCDPIEDVCDYLGIQRLYRPIEAFVKVTFGKQSVGANKQMYGIYMNHGAGGGSFPGASMNKIERMSMSVNADIYVFGHFHKRMAYKHEHRHVDMIHNRITERERLFVVSSHWQTFDGYAATKMLQPSAKGSVPITLYSDRKRMEATI
jgi:predicted phosphodiesterase